MFRPASDWQVLGHHRLLNASTACHSRFTVMQVDFRWSGVLSYGHPERTARTECAVYPPANPCRTMQCRENRKTPDDRDRGGNRLFELLLGAELVGVAALALAAVGRTRRKASLGSCVSHSTCCLPR